MRHTWDMLENLNLKSIVNGFFQLKVIFVFFLQRYRLTDSTIDSARLLAQTINLEGKFDLRVSTFGTSSGILVHCEKTGSKAVRS